MKIISVLLLLLSGSSLIPMNHSDPVRTFVDAQGCTHRIVGQGDTAREYVSRNGNPVYAYLPLPNGRRVTMVISHGNFQGSRLPTVS